MRNISNYNLEQLKERLRGWTDATMRRFQSNIQEYKPFITQNPLLPQVVAVQDTEDADDGEELASLEKLLQQEISDIEQIKGRLVPLIQSKLQTNEKLTLDETEQFLNH